MRLCAIIITIIPVVFLTACVSGSKYDAVISEKNAMRHSLNTAQEEIEANLEKIQATELKLRNAELKLASSKMEVAKAQEEIERNLQKIKETELKLASSKLEVAKAQEELMALEERKQALQKELSESQEQIATLSNIEAETKRRNEIYAQFVNRLQAMIDGGQLTVSIEQGRIVINLPNNVLFKSGSANLNPEGNNALTEIAAALSQFSDRRFQIEGHTDDKPIKSARFPSNWELSTSRALNVVHLLTEMGVAPENISAAGFGEFRPRADNESNEGRKLNRRIEIIMQPNLDILSSELPKVTQ